MDETEYLLNSKANKKHLLEAIKSKKFTQFTSEEFDEYSKQLIKSTMKDKFKKIIKEQILIVPIKNRYEIRGIIAAANRCNILHQQAMKEEREKRREAIKRIHQWLKSDSCWIEDEKGKRLPKAIICGEGLNDYMINKTL